MIHQLPVTPPTCPSVVMHNNFVTAKFKAISTDLGGEGQRVVPKDATPPSCGQVKARVQPAGKREGERDGGGAKLMQKKRRRYNLVGNVKTWCCTFVDELGICSL